jgi:hypothetical protein
VHHGTGQPGCLRISLHVDAEKEFRKAAARHALNFGQERLKLGIAQHQAEELNLRRPQAPVRSPE